jgi:hypothetical protein
MPNRLITWQKEKGIKGVPELRRSNPLVVYSRFDPHNLELALSWVSTIRFLPAGSLIPLSQLRN